MKVSEAMRPNAVSWVLCGLFLTLGLVLSAIGGLVLLVGDDPVPLFIGLSWIVVASGMGLLLYVMRRRTGRSAAVRETGIPGTATVLEARATHTRAGQGRMPGRVWRVRLRVECAGMAPYDVDTRLVPQVGYSGLEPGSTWPVYVDRANPENVEVDWAALQASAYTIELGPGIMISSQNPIELGRRTDDE